MTIINTISEAIYNLKSFCKTHSIYFLNNKTEWFKLTILWYKKNQK